MRTLGRVRVLPGEAGNRFCAFGGFALIRQPLRAATFPQGKVRRCAAICRKLTENLRAFSESFIAALKKV